MDRQNLMAGLRGRKLFPARERAAAPPKRRRRRHAASIVWAIVRAVLLISLSYVLLYPLLSMLSVAVRPYTELADPSVVWIPKSLTLDNFVKAWEAMDYGNTLLTTLQLNVVSSLLQVACAAVTGYGFARFEFRGKKLFFALVILTILVPPQTFVIPSFLDYNRFDFFGVGSLIGLFTGEPLTVNLLNTAWTFYLPALFANGLRGGLFVFIFRQFFRGLPRELEDAAYIDGCGFVRTFLSIMVPLAGAAFLSSFLFSLVWYWNDTLSISMFFTEKKTVSYALDMVGQSLTSSFEEQGNYFLKSARLQAACVLTVGPMVLVYMVLQRYFTESIDKVGIKG